MVKAIFTQKKSLIGYPAKQRRTMCALGFGTKGKINKAVEHELTSPIQGMLRQVAHLVTVENK